MWTFIISFILFCLALTAMAIGTILGGKSIAGSCGGIAGITGLKSSCDACSEPCKNKSDQL